jgi:Tol biopolymer transport system component
MPTRKIVLAVAASALFTVILSLLSNLAASYLAPAWSHNPWLIYILLVIFFIASLAVTIYLFLKTSPNVSDAEAMVAKATSEVTTPQSSQPRGYKAPVPRIRPLPENVEGKIAFLQGYENNTEFVIAESDGSHPSVVAKATWSIYCPRIAPGGKKMVFISAYEGREHVYTIDGDGSNLKRLTGGARYEGPAAWSPDGTKLVYTREYSISNDIYVMDGDGNDQKNLTEMLQRRGPSSYKLSEFPWSPDGQNIVFSSNRDGRLNMYVLDKDGRNLRQITKDADRQNYGAVWAPNGNTIAYVSTGDLPSQTDIYTLDLDSAGLTPINITNNPHHNSNPVWSPDGTQILFVSNRDGNHELYIVNSDGSNVRRITHTAESKDNPSWLR